MISFKITKQGEVVNEAAWRAKMARREHKRRLKDALATAIVNKAIDMEVEYYIFKQIHKTVNDRYFTLSSKMQLNFISSIKQILDKTITIISFMH